MGKIMERCAGIAGVRHGSGMAAEVVENIEPSERRRTLGTSPASNGGGHHLTSGAYSSTGTPRHSTPPSLAGLASGRCCSTASVAHAPFALADCGYAAPLIVPGTNTPLR